MKMLKVIAELLAGKHTDTNNVSIVELNTRLLKTNKLLINECTQIKP